MEWPDMHTENLIDVKQVSLVLPAPTGVQCVLEDVSLSVEPGEFVCIVGPSGCGKTSLLRVLGGLLPPTAGTVSVAGKLLTAPRRDIGFVFQRANLMPWRTVEHNVMLPLEIRGIDNGDARSQAAALLDLVGLSGYQQAFPRQLSGGMQQRVVLARALIQDPLLLLMDEPFGALDALTRERMNLELLRIWSETQKTIVFVTHSINEAVFLADRVLVMNPAPGRIVAEFAVSLPRPRHLDMQWHDAFGGYVDAIREAIACSDGSCPPM